MAGKKGPNKQAARQRAARQAQAAAVRQQRRRARQRIIVGVVAVALVAGLVLAILTSGGSSGKATSDTTTTPTTAPALASAAGKPCVEVADPLPAGAPAVPVEVGAPPAKLVVKDLKAGAGPAVTASQTLTVNYIGVACSTGKIFDSSYKTGKPASFPLTGVIPGWQQGIPGMKVGGQRLLGIPPDLAYGSDGAPPDIAPDETLWFVIDIVDAK